jgi:translation initiation factor IF-2
VTAPRPPRLFSARPPSRSGPPPRTGVSAARPAAPRARPSASRSRPWAPSATPPPATSARSTEPPAAAAREARTAAFPPAGPPAVARAGPRVAVVGQVQRGSPRSASTAVLAHPSNRAVPGPAPPTARAAGRPGGRPVPGGRRKSPGGRSVCRAGGAGRPATGPGGRARLTPAARPPPRAVCPVTRARLRWGPGRVRGRCPAPSACLADASARDGAGARGPRGRGPRHGPGARGAGVGAAGAGAGDGHGRPGVEPGSALAAGDGLSPKAYRGRRPRSPGPCARRTTRRRCPGCRDPCRRCRRGWGRGRRRRPGPRRPPLSSSP